jgi:polysaccharide export outer membrane protein
MLFRTIFCLTLALNFEAGLGAQEPSPTGPATAEISPASQLDYILRPFDLVQVVVFQEPDIERKARLSEESSLTLPLIGTVNLAGKTVRQAQDLITDLYNRDYLVNPQVNITVLEYAKVTVNVLGSVTNPGSIAIPPDQPLKLIDAVTRAGGFTRLADRKRVKLTRITKDGATTTTIINVDDILQSTSSDSWILQKGDVIYVPERIL